MRVALLLSLLTGCNLFGSATGVVGEPSQQGLTDPSQTDVVGTGTGLGGTEAASGDQLQATYIRSVCKLYTQPSCVTNQQQSCGNHIAFDSMSACETFFERTASACVGLKDALAAHPDAVARCTAQLDTFQCDAAPVCDSNGLRLDSRNGCAQVQALIAACDPSDDTGI